MPGYACLELIALANKKRESNAKRQIFSHSVSAIFSIILHAMHVVNIQNDPQSMLM